MRTVPLSICRALVARDRGCAFPGCDRPPAMCQVHHCQHWAHHGETKVENCMLCARCITGTCTAPAGKSSSTPATSTSSHQRSLTRPADHSVTHSAAKSMLPPQSGRRQLERHQPGAASEDLPHPEGPTTSSAAPPAAERTSSESCLISSARPKNTRWAVAISAAHQLDATAAEVTTQTTASAHRSRSCSRCRHLSPKTHRQQGVQQEAMGHK